MYDKSYKIAQIRPIIITFRLKVLVQKYIYFYWRCESSIGYPPPEADAGVCGTPYRADTHHVGRGKGLKKFPSRCAAVHCITIHDHNA